MSLRTTRAHLAHDQNVLNTLGKACTETIADAMTSGKERAESIRGLVRMGYAYTPDMPPQHTAW